MGATEIAILSLQDGKNPDDPTTAAGQIHAEALKTLLSQPGVQQAYWGREVQNPLRLRWFVDWDDIEDHKKFMSSDVYKPFLEQFGSILTGAAAYHARFSPHPPRTTLSNSTSPVTEIVTMWFPASYSNEDQEHVAENAKGFGSIAEKEVEGCKAYAGSWVDEEIDIPGIDEKGKVYVMMIGWRSMEAHKEFQDAQLFKDNIHRLQGAKDLKKMETVHASLAEVTASVGT